MQNSTVTPATPPRMRTILETSHITGVAAYRIRVLCKTGQICALQCGSRWLINLDRFIEFLNSPQEAPQPKPGSIRKIEA